MDMAKGGDDTNSYHFAVNSHSWPVRYQVAASMARRQAGYFGRVQTAGVRATTGAPRLPEAARPYIKERDDTTI